MAGGTVIRSTRGAYLALAVLTLVWGSNWIVMKFALQNAHPALLNMQRTWIAVVLLFAVLLWRGEPLWPGSWLAVIVTGTFQTTINFTATTMALAGGGAGRTSVLVFTMPFWTLLLAAVFLHERVKGTQWFAIAFAVLGMVLIVEPWNWHGDLQPKLWAVLSGFGWGAGAVCTKYFQRHHKLEMLNFLAWQMLVGVLPLSLIPLLFEFPPSQWSVTHALLMFYVGGVSTAFGFLLWIAVLRYLPAGTASLNTFAIPVIALVLSMLIFGERLTFNEWTGIACIGAGLAIVSWNAWRVSRQGEATPTPPTPLEGG
ncbi:MAG: DMT family transporter [Casimicrobiaceae bacterium]